MELKFLTFHLGREVFAINIMKVERVKEYEKTTRMPNIADYVEGIINLMGEIIPIINLRKKFMLEDFDNKEKTKVIVVKLENGKKVGFLVDDVREVLTVTEDVIDEPPAHVAGMANAKFISGVIKLPNEMILTLEVDSLLTSEEKVALANLS
ncbi:MAG: chemotaxis protein CheW [Fervidobacterium sp.]|uniref:Purine-binding chemotaxis protein CheW n=1 Tax=Fervidobacterium gondwanense DSM 13020 TaxID=1121883 RepID=A0A1M7T2E8_FERGO|nr:chemotaxis protein CheW [Fervidobacterium gondwanense]UXF01683.1 chemotaxis protein CheW [Fervidobacterium riparium]SHN64923.1 purine-binding chemotaxis protein CheW [Fervidobacterium gondwanense DSM 13020]